MRSFAVFLVAASLAAALPAARAQKVVLGMSGWTGFSPLSLADKADIFKRNGVDVELRMIPPVPRSAALASGALNAAATTVDQHIVWMSAGIRSEEHTSELQSRLHLVCRLLLEKKKKNIQDLD